MVPGLEKGLTVASRVLRDGLVRHDGRDVVVAVERGAHVRGAEDGIGEDEGLRRAAARAVEVADGVELSSLAGGHGRGRHGGGARDEGEERGNGETHDDLGDGGL